MATPSNLAGDTSYDENANNGTTIAPASGETEQQRVLRYAKEMKQWQEALRPYWTQMTKNEELYEFYKAEYTETAVNIALNTPFAIIESQIAKENQASLMVTVQAEGENNLAEFEKWVGAAVKQIIEDRRVAAIKGTFRKKKERFSRQLKVVGNSVAEVAYCYVTQVINGKKTVVADNPYIINRHYKQLIFNPARQFDSSNVYYVIDHMRFEDMKAQEFVKQKDKDGKEVTTGKFKNLDQLQKSMRRKGDMLSDDTEIRYNSGDTKISKKNEPIEVVTRWELKPAGWTRCVFASGRVLVMGDQVDPYKIGGHNLLLAMRYVVEGRPYAYGEMDPIYKIARAQDTIVNQKIEIINKYLRGSYIAGSSIDVDSLMMVLQQGGVMNGDGTDLHSVPVITPPQGAFLETAELQQALERAARWSPLDNGNPQAAQGEGTRTKGGLVALQGAAEPGTESQIDDLEDMFLEPYAYMSIKMKSEYMSPDETFFAMLEGKTSEWVKIAKGILAGQATLQDFLNVGVLTQEQAQSVIGQAGPNNQTITNQTVLFDTDWLIKITLSAESAQEKANQLSQEQALIEFAVKELGVQVDPDRTFGYLADKKDSSDLKTLLLNPEEKQARQQQMQQAQQQHVQSEIAIKQAGKSTPAPAHTDERVSIMTNYKDAPPDVQRQIEAIDGLVPSQMQPQVAQTMKQPLPSSMQIPSPLEQSQLQQQPITSGQQ